MHIWMALLSPLTQSVKIAKFNIRCVQTGSWRVYITMLNFVEISLFFQIFHVI